MRRSRNHVLVALGGLLLCGCQSQQPREGAYVDFVMDMMVESAKLSQGPSDAAPAVGAVETWRGTTGGEGDAD